MPNKPEMAMRAIRALGKIRKFVCLALMPFLDVGEMMIMKRVLQGIQVVGFLVFTMLLLITIFWKAEIKDLARDFINQRIEPKVTKTVDLGEELLRSPKVLEYVSDEQLVVISEEMDLYKNDPQGYIRSLTSDSQLDEIASVAESEVGNLIIRSIAAKITSWKQSINQYFNEVFERIIFDLRMFSSTNIVAFVVAFWLSTRRGAIDVIPYWIASAILTGSIIYCTMMYVDQNWFFTILLDSFMGATYPFTIAVVFGYILYRYSEIRGNLDSNNTREATAASQPADQF